MRIFRCLIPLVVLLSSIFPTPGNAQSVSKVSNFTIRIENGQFSLKGVVDSEETKRRLLETLRADGPFTLSEEMIVINPQSAPFPQGWEGVVRGKVTEIRTWKSGLYSYSANVHEETAAFAQFLAVTKVIEVDGLIERPLLDPSKRATVIYLFAVWERPSRMYLTPRMNEVYKEFGKRGLDIIAVSADDDANSTEVLRKYKKDQGIDFRLAHENEELVKRMLSYSRFNGIPQAILVQDGSIKLISIGGSRDEVKRLVENITPIFPH